MNITSTLFSKIAGRKREWQAAVIHDVRDLAMAIGRAELGLSDADIEADHAAEILSASGLSEGDFRATLDGYKHRVELAKLATDADALQSAARKSENAWREADRQEGIRRQAVHQELQGLEAKMYAAVRSANQAMAARSDLIASAATSDEEKAATAKLAGLNKHAAALRERLNPRPRDHAGNQIGAGNVVPSCEQHPAAAELAAEHELREIANGRAGDRDVVKARLRAARQHKGDAERALRAVEEQIADVNEQSRQFASDKLKAEAFHIVKSQPSADERRKERAKEMGFGRGDIGYAVHR